jgi:TonB family protein
LYEKIYNAWNIPPQSKGLQAKVLLIINRAGNVEQARLVQGSGNTLFDESLQRAIKQAQPLPALPASYTDSSLRVELRFRERG